MPQIITFYPQYYILYQNNFTFRGCRPMCHQMQGLWSLAADDGRLHTRQGLTTQLVTDCICM